MIFEPIPTDRIRPMWGWVKECLERLSAKAGGTDGWWPEDVYRELMEGRSTLIETTTEEGHRGFLVCRIYRDTVGPILYVWLIYAPGQMRHTQDYMDFLLATADRHVCYKIEGGSFRKGWEPHLKRLGFRPMTTWELNLERR